MRKFQENPIISYLIAFIFFSEFIRSYGKTFYTIGYFARYDYVRITLSNKQRLSSKLKAIFYEA